MLIAGGENVIPVINQLRQKFEVVAFTRDWHCQQHVSFASMHEGLDYSIYFGNLFSNFSCHLYTAHVQIQKNGLILVGNFRQNLVEIVQRITQRV